jgi:hypothetical protein
MLLKKNMNTASISYTKVVPIRSFARRLESLYARRSAVEDLIRSLEDYQRFRAQRLEQRESKSA